MTPRTREQIYDRIGADYGRFRRPDPRLARRILDALEGVSTVVNVGAGTGSYEPGDRAVVAVEPSTTMIRQRRASTAPVVRARAEALPFGDAAFDASLAILTIQHWLDLDRGLAELRRVARERVVILTWDPAGPGFWLMDYFPEIREIDRETMPSLDHLRARLGRVQVFDVPVPEDCTDGFLGASWRRPDAYLSETARSAISVFGRIREPEAGLERLARDLRSGAWHRRHGSLLARSELDLGYRLIVAR